MSARVQLFDLKTKYVFNTQANVHQYNMPLYGVNGYPQQGNSLQQTISYYPVYQGFTGMVNINGYSTTLYTDRLIFENIHTKDSTR